MDAPAPVDHSGTVFDQIHRSGDVGGNACIRIAVDDHVKARADVVQAAQKATVAALIPGRGEDPRDRGAVAIRFVGVAAVHAGALRVRSAVTQIIGEIRGVKIDVALDHPNANGLGVDLIARAPYAPLIEVHRIEKAVGGPLLIVFGGRGRIVRFALDALLGAGLFGDHCIDADLIAEPQHQGIPLIQIIRGQTQLVGVQRGDHAHDLGTVLIRQAPCLFGAVVALFDDQADQIHIGANAVHVIGDVLLRGRDYVAAS